MLNSPARSTPPGSSTPSDLPPMPPSPNIQQKPFEEKPPQPSKAKLSLLALTFTILLIIAFFVWKNQYQTRQLELSGSRDEQQASLPDDSTPTAPKPSPSPVPILQGIETYTISQGSKNNGPKITQAIINPHDPQMNDNQTVSVKLAYAQPIDQVKLKLSSDNDQKEIDMTLAQGTATDGTWETNWEITDTVLYNYSQTITAQSGDQTSSITITIRQL